jgi:hypothetical protein
MSETDQAFRTTRCRSCGEEVALPRKAPAYGTTLVCSTCKAPLQAVYEDVSGCLGCDPNEVRAIFGYEGCAIEHPRCPWCAKIVYAVLFPELGAEVAWYANRQQENPQANYTIQVECPSCGNAFCVEWDGWPFRLDSQMRCNFCGVVGVGHSQFSTLPEDRRADFERLLGRNPSTLSYLRDDEGHPVWVTCPVCINTALSAFQKEQGPDVAKLVEDHFKRLTAMLSDDRADRTTNWTREVFQRVLDQELAQICLVAHEKMEASLVDGERHSASFLVDDLFVSISTFPCSVEEARRKYYREGYLPHLDRMVNMGRQENPHCHWLHFQFFWDGNDFWFHFTLCPNMRVLDFPPRYELPIELLSNEEKRNLGLQ